MRSLSLFSGIGGIDLGLERAGHTVVAQSEIDPYCCRVLAKHWPDVPNLGDVTTIDWNDHHALGIELVAGGYPCQPFSLASAGRRKGTKDVRHLWPYMLDAIRVLRPRYALLENVPGHLSLGFDRVLGDLAESGYDAEWNSVSAASVGAPHRRDRVIVIAYPNGNDERDLCLDAEMAGASSTHGRLVADAGVSVGPRLREGQPPAIWWRRPCDFDSAYTTWAVEPDVGGTLDGFSSWLDRSGRLAEPHKLLLAHGNAAGCSAAEVVSDVRDHFRAENDQWAFGGRDCLSSEEVLLAFLRQLEAHSGQAGQPLASEETPQTSLRGVRLDEVAARPPLRRPTEQQRPHQSPDPLYALSQLLARAAGTAWAAYRRSDASPTTHWESGVARVATGVPHRVDRLRGLGNAVVPQVAEYIGRLLAVA